MTSSIHFFFYAFGLALTLGKTLVELAWFKIAYLPKLLGVYTVTCVVITVIVVSSFPVQSQPEFIETSPPPHQELLNSTFMTKEELEQKKLQYDDLLRKQPTHRDILLNAALTARALDDEKTFQLYWQKARAVDPNYPVFR